MWNSVCFLLSVSGSGSGSGSINQYVAHDCVSDADLHTAVESLRNENKKKRKGFMRSDEKGKDA